MTQEAPNVPTFVLTLRPAPGWSMPAITRLRKLLKLALRSCGLRCTSVYEAPSNAQQEPRADVRTDLAITEPDAPEAL